MGTFAVCFTNQSDPRVDARAIIITRLRPRLGQDSNRDRIPEREDGQNIHSCENP
jgi:hypothetical protein